MLSSDKLSLPWWLFFLFLLLSPPAGVTTEDDRSILVEFVGFSLFAFWPVFRFAIFLVAVRGDMVIFYFFLFEK
jgi:succinate-acetate transporter protein